MRRVAAVRRAPFLAAAQIQLGEAKPRGLGRWKRKLAKAGFALLHRRLRLPAIGDIVIDPDGLGVVFRADFSDTAYIDLASRTAAGGYEPDVSALIEFVAPRINVAYDVGANWGYYMALLMSHPGFRGRVHAFEIAPRSFASLARLVSRCGFGARVECHPYGLSDRSGAVAIEESTHSALTRVAPSGCGRPAHVARLDDLALPAPDLVNVDVEGHELAVFRGAANVMARAKPIIVFESWEHGDATAMQCLADWGYRFFRLVLTPNGRNGVLELLPLSVKTRPATVGTLNILAINPRRESLAEELPELRAELA